MILVPGVVYSYMEQRAVPEVYTSSMIDKNAGIVIEVLFVFLALVLHFQHIGGYRALFHLKILPFKNSNIIDTNTCRYFRILIYF